MELVDKLEHPDLNMQGKLQCPGNVPARDTIGDRWGEGFPIETTALMRHTLSLRRYLGSSLKPTVARCFLQFLGL